MLYSQAVESTKLQMEEGVSLAPYTTLGIGGPARYLAHVTAEPQLLEAVEFARSKSLSIFILGGGSNLLVSDRGFPGLVVHIAIQTPSVQSGDEYTAAAGLEWDDFVHSICEQGISGIECMAGIPGLVGGTPVQNVGAYGQEVAETIRSVRALDLETMEFVALEKEACGFGYRRSIFNSTHRGRYIVTAVTFGFDRSSQPVLAYADLVRHFAGNPQPTPIEIYHAVRGIRQGKGMLLTAGDPDSRSAGSFFKNPIVPADILVRIASFLHIEEDAVPCWPAAAGMVKLPAAWLVERAGFHKGYAMGAAGISSRHTLALVNRGGASFAEITMLRDAVQHEVANRFGVQLEQEPVQIGD